MKLLIIVACVCADALGQPLHEVGRLLAEDHKASEQLATAVSLSRRVALLGAPWDNDQGINSGTAYLFDIMSGRQLSKLSPTDGQPDDRFGTAVAIDGSAAVVGAYLHDDFGRRVININWARGLLTCP